MQRVGKSEWRGERHASAPIFSSATGCAGNNNHIIIAYFTLPYTLSQIST